MTCTSTSGTGGCLLESGERHVFSWAGVSVAPWSSGSSKDAGL
jgi:hypothetical protein